MCGAHTQRRTNVPTRRENIGGLLSDHVGTFNRYHHTEQAKRQRANTADYPYVTERERKTHTFLVVIRSNTGRIQQEKINKMGYLQEREDSNRMGMGWKTRWICFCVEFWQSKTY